MRRLVPIAAALVLAACSDAGPVASGRDPAAAPRQAVSAASTQWSIYTSQQPDQTLDAAPGWEVGTKFRTTSNGYVVGFRFWRAAGETGTNHAQLWTNTGSNLRSMAMPSGTGWVSALLSVPVRIGANQDYRVSINTNTKQVKCGGCFATQGAITNGPLSASGGHYGQPTGSMPTTSSSSMFFIDVIFEPDPPPAPNLYVAQLVANGGKNLAGQEIVTVGICNNGGAPAAASTTRVKHWWAPLSGGAWQLQWSRPYSTPSLGGCQTLQPTTSSPIGQNLYEVFADSTNAVAESNEGDNYRYTVFVRQQ